MQCSIFLEFNQACIKLFLNPVEAHQTSIIISGSQIKIFSCLDGWGCLESNKCLFFSSSFPKAQINIDQKTNLHHSAIKEK